MDRKLLITNAKHNDYLFAGHAGAGPSSAHRWMGCTGSLELSKMFLETLTEEQQGQFALASTAARQGTTAHAAAEIRARGALGLATPEEVSTELMHLTYDKDEDESYSDDMERHLQEYLDLIDAYRKERGNQCVRLETLASAIVPLSGDYEGTHYQIGGTADLLVEPDGKRSPELVIGDLKYGTEPVEVEANPQLRIYALGYLSEGGFLETTSRLPSGVPKKITYHIIQPRNGGISTWSEPVRSLLKWRDEVLSPALTAALFGADAGATFNPSLSNCQWCPAKGTCAALAGQRMEEAADLFDAIVEAPGDDVKAMSLSDAELGKLLQQALGLTTLADDLKEEVNRRLLRGTSVPGFKLVSYTPPRRWKPEAAEALAEVEDIWESKLITPAKAIKAFGDQAAMLDDLIDTPNKRPVTAPENDRRKEWVGADPETMFKIEGD